MNDIANERKQLAPLDKFREQFDARRAELAGSLPAHIPFERYKRVIMNAVSRNPELLNADRASLLISVAQAAADGLLCDGRDAALVIFRTKRKYKDGNVEREEWINAVQYMPMIAGILKKLRNSGQLSAITARVVYGGDKYRNWIDDDGEHVNYEAVEDQDRNVIRCVFAMAKLKDGSVEVEELKPADIEKIRNVSRAKNSGPWVDWWEEMAKKSAIRRLSKRLPISTDLDDLMRRDDALYDLDGKSDRAANATGGSRPLSNRERMDALAGMGGASRGRAQVIDHDPGTGEVLDLTRGDDEVSDDEPATQSSERAGHVDASAQGTGPATSSQAGPVTENTGRAEGGSRSRAKSADKAAQADQRAEASDGRQQERGPPASGGKATNEAKAGAAAGGDLSEEDKDLQADLLGTGRNAAAQGQDALDEFEEGLNQREKGLLGPYWSELYATARKAGGAK